MFDFEAFTSGGWGDQRAELTPAWGRFWYLTWEKYLSIPFMKSQRAHCQTETLISRIKWESRVDFPASPHVEADQRDSSQQGHEAPGARQRHL